MKFKQNFAIVHRGFSLIEILVVVVIISIFTSAIVLTFNPNDTAGNLKQESLRLQRVLSIALDEAQIHGSQMGLVVTEEGYQFLILADRMWLPVSEDKALETHYWPKGTEIFLTLEGLASSENESQSLFSLSNNFSEKLERDRDRDTADEDDSLSFTLEDSEENEQALKTRPQIYILSSGETTPFELLIMQLEDDKEVYFQITANYVGKVAIDGPFNEKPQRTNSNG